MREGHERWEEAEAEARLTGKVTGVEGGTPIRCTGSHRQPPGLRPYAKYAAPDGRKLCCRCATHFALTKYQRQGWTVEIADGHLCWTPPGGKPRQVLD